MAKSKTPVNTSKHGITWEDLPRINQVTKKIVIPRSGSIAAFLKKNGIKAEDAKFADGSYGSGYYGLHVQINGPETNDQLKTRFHKLMKEKEALEKKFNGTGVAVRLEKPIITRIPNAASDPIKSIK